MNDFVLAMLAVNFAAWVIIIAAFKYIIFIL